MVANEGYDPGLAYQRSDLVDDPAGCRRVLATLKEHFIHTAVGERNWRYGTVNGVAWADRPARPIIPRG